MSTTRDPSPADALGALLHSDAATLLLSGKPLAMHALRTLEAAEVQVLDPATPWAVVQARGRPVVLHDPACPLTPPTFLRDLAAEAQATGHSQAGVRPVTDTVKTRRGRLLGETRDRSGLVVLTSPVVLCPDVVAELARWPEPAQLPALVSRLRRASRLRLVEAPALSRRIADESDLRLLAAAAA